MKKILITGGLGYIGTKFLDSSYENLEILVFDTNYFTNKSLNNSSFLVVNDIRNF